jgi:polar amino acid transport system substrate-binding protein
MRFIYIYFILVSSVWGEKPLDKVSIQLDWKFQYEFAGFVAAKEKGFYRDVGLDVDLREYQNSVDTASDIINRKATYGSYNSSIIVSGGKLAPVVLLGTYLQRSPLVFAVRKGINNPAELVGKKIMATKDEFRSSSIGLMLNHFEITPANTNFLLHSFNMNDFITGKCDAITVFRSNQLYELDRLKIPYTVIDPADYGFVMSAVNVFTSRSEALENPERTQKFIEATNRGWQYALDHPYEIIDLLLKKYNTGKSRDALIYEYQVTKKLMMTDLYPIGQANEELTVRAYKQLLHSGRLLGDQKLGKFMFQEIIASNNVVQMTTAQKYYLLNKKKIVMCIDPEWYPFEAIRDGRHIGIAADVMKEFEKRLGIPIEFYPVESWEESITLAKKRECDIFSLASSTPERLQYMDFTSPYVTLPIVMATKMDKPFTEDITSLGNVKLGSVKGYAITEQLKTHYPDLNIVEVESITDGLNLVESGELYGYIDNLMVISSYIQKEHTGMLKVSLRLKEKVELSVGTRNDEPMLKDIFEKLVLGIDPILMQNFYNRYATVIREQNPYGLMILAILALIASISILILGWNYLLRKKVRAEVAKNLRIKDQLYQKTKQAEIGNLIANISHQWREPLSKLSSINLLNIAKIRTGQPIENGWLLKQSQKVEDTIDFMSHTMQNFLEFYKQSSVKADFSVYESIESSIAIIETKILDFGVHVVIEGDDSVLYGIKNEWMQVWLNLLNNSIKIFEERNIENPMIRIEISVERINFCDNGGGMDTLEEHSGLGHQMCQEIATKYGARLEFMNKDEGLCVTVVLR